MGNLELVYRHPFVSYERGSGTIAWTGYEGLNHNSCKDCYIATAHQGYMI